MSLSNGEAVMVAIFGILAFLVVFGALTLLGGVILMLAWNVVVPVAFHGPHLGFWQAVGLSVLVGMIRQLVSVTVNHAKK